MLQNMSAILTPKHKWGHYKFEIKLMIKYFSPSYVREKSIKLLYSILFQFYMRFTVENNLYLIKSII